MSSLSQGIIHGDTHPYNHFYSKLNKKISFFDFELSGYGYKVYDLAIFKWNQVLHQRKMSNNNTQMLIDGYLSVNKINRYELELINLFVKIKHLFALEANLSYPEISIHQDFDYWKKYLNINLERALET